MKNQKTAKGYSIIELLVTISLLAILSTIGLYSFSNANKRSNDAERKNDLSQYRTSLEAFANKNDGLYPAHTTVVTIGSANLCAASALNIPNCPSGSSPYDYKYLSDGTSGATATEYLLYVRLEAPSSVTYFGLCSSGSSLSQAAVPTLTNCN